LIKLRQRVDELKAERDAAKQEAVSARQDAVTRAEADRKRIDGLMIQVQDMRAEIERLKTPPRSHPVKVGKSVRRTTEGSIAPIGTVGRVLVVGSDAYQVELRKGFSTMWAFDDCTPCDPPPEASHITPEGKQTAEGAVEPKPGDVVRLVRVPSEDTVGDTLRKSLEWPWKSLWGSVGDRGEVVESVGTMPGARSVRIMNTGVKVWWPLSCVEIVKGGTPCDPPTASHDTPAGKETAQAAAEPKPGDVVRLVRVPTVKDCSKYDFQDSEQLRLISTQVNTMGKVVGTELCEACACVVDDTGTIKAWPLSCIEVVKGVDK